MNNRNPITNAEKKTTTISQVCSVCSKPPSSNLYESDTCRCPQDGQPSNVSKEHEERDLAEVVLPSLPENFNVIGCVGKGGMASVFKAIDTESGITFAVKVLPDELADDLEAKKRFEQEANALSKLDHPNIVSVHGYGTTSSAAPYLVMDFVEGETLCDQIKREGPLSDVERAITLFTELCEALSYAHKNSILHRDLKPANILVRAKNAEGSSTKITDFGIAKVLPSGSSEVRETHDLTKTGELFGTPLYMSPEQCLGFKLDERSDIYSLGCLMYEVMTGKPPFDAPNAVQVVVKHLNEIPKPILKATGKQFSSLEKVIFKCLAKHKEEDRKS
ncbi:MAG: serine/threonine protein kinase, partial [Candidatus Obscuribacterales bacterium]|nr:serine/threonine protein kinase [Candidatus Obscuribacterales bacterium]